MEHKPIDEERLREQIKNELEEDFKKRFERKRRKHGGTRTCCGCVMLVILILAALGVYFFKAETVRFPWVGDIWHKENMPVRWVDINISKELNIGEFLESKLEEELGKKITGVHDLAGLFSNEELSSVDIRVSEEELTQFLQGIREEGNSEDVGNPQIRVEYIQTVIEKDFIELFLVLQEPFHGAVRIRFVPSIESEHLRISVTQAILGRLELPKVVREAVFEKTIEPEISLLNKALQQTLPSRIELVSGQIVFQGINFLELVKFSQDDSPQPNSWINLEALNF